MLSIVIEGEQRKGVLILYPGQTVRGAVRYTPEKAEKILGVYCKFVSYEHSEWRSKSARMISRCVVVQTRPLMAKLDAIDLAPPLPPSVSIFPEIKLHRFHCDKSD